MTSADPVALDNNDEQDIASASSLPPDAISSLKDDELKILGESGQEIMGDSMTVKVSSGVSISGGGGGSSAAPEHDNVVDVDDDDDHALAQMMALQEEQQDDDGITDRATNVDDDAANPPVRPFNNLLLAIQQYDAEQAARNNNNDDNGFEGEDNDHPMNNILPIPHNQQRHSILHTLFSTFRPSLRYIPLSFLSAFLLIHHTLRTRQQFYLAMTYLSTSKLSYIILGNAIIAFYVKVFTLVTQLFLEGGLRPNERDSIGEQMRWDVTETCLALTMFRSELDVGTAIKFLTLVVMKG